MRDTRDSTECTDLTLSRAGFLVQIVWGPCLSLEFELELGTGPRSGITFVVHAEKKSYTVCYRSTVNQKSRIRAFHRRLRLYRPFILLRRRTPANLITTLALLPFLYE
ncbi:uncharacterized protein LOC133032751 [Cannabis sativa]|uniref:uncharacterized protein LOC133032751 n=1 Tax=Cannabis sativa TaxID=3483 RepID=UPI0029CA8149|nr:uncharacterized protein LOC133032751 [Cannabis sativa]